MVGWHHWLNADEFEQAPGDVEGQGSLVCWSPWGCKGLCKTEWLSNNNNHALGKKKWQLTREIVSSSLILRTKRGLEKTEYFLGYTFLLKTLYKIWPLLCHSKYKTENKNKKGKNKD